MATWAIGAEAGVVAWVADVVGAEVGVATDATDAEAGVVAWGAVVVACPALRCRQPCPTLPSALPCPPFSAPLVGCLGGGGGHEGFGVGYVYLIGWEEGFGVFKPDFLF